MGFGWHQACILKGVGGLMNSTIVRSLVLFVGSFVLVVAFQNCGQPGAISQATDLQKAADPLVVDVVSEMETQNNYNYDNDKEYSDDKEYDDDKSYDYGKKDDAKKYEDDKKYPGEDKKYAEDDKEEDKKDYDKKYDDELEEVLANYSCEDNGMSSQSKKVLVCHHPKGNPAQRHEICIAREALKAHLEKHQHAAGEDHLGKCHEEEEE